MALAKRDAIDEKLTEMYFDKVTVNLEDTNRIAPEEFWNQRTGECGICGRKCKNERVSGCNGYL